MTTKPTQGQGDWRCWVSVEHLLAAANVIEEHDNGDVTTEVDILELVPQEHGRTGKFHVTPEHADRMVRNHAVEREMGYHPPLVAGHEADDTNPDLIAGWIQSLVRIGTRLRMKVRVLKDFVGKVKAGKVRYVSPEFSLAPKTKNSVGDEIGAKLFRVAITATPHQKGADGSPVGQFVLSAISDGADNGDDHQMTVELQALAERVEATEAALSENGTKLDAITEKVGEIAELKATMTGLAEQLTALSATSKTDAEEEAKKALAEKGKDYQALEGRIKEQDDRLTKLTADSKARTDELTEQLDASQLEKDNDRARIALDDAVADGKLLLADMSTDWMEAPHAEVKTLGYTSLSTFVKRMASIPKGTVAPPTDPKSVSTATETSDITTDSLRAVGLMEKVDSGELTLDQAKARFEKHLRHADELDRRAG